MDRLNDRIHAADVSQGSAAIWWLGQAGFAFKSSGGQVTYLDPYLSNAVEKLVGFKRLSLAPIAAEDVRADWLLCSHEHGDHLDPDALPIISTNNPDCRFAGSTHCAAEFDGCGIPPGRQLVMEPGKAYKLGEIEVHTGRADHGELSPSALALLLDFGAVRVMFTGDTCLNMDYLQPMIDLKPDIVLPCINGSYGNLNAQEAAQVTAASRARAVIPCHFWMFKEHHTVPGGDPHSFFESCKTLCLEADIRLLTPGEGILVTPNSIEELCNT